MGEQINKDFDKFQEELRIKEKRLKLNVSFEVNDNLDEIVDDLKNKEVIL